MSNDALVAPLLRVALFRGLKPNQLADLARRAERIVFKAGELIVSEGQPGDAAYLIVSGSAEIVADDDAALAEAAPVVEGSLIGEMAILVEHDYAATIRATTAVRALKFSRVRLYGLMERDPTLAEHFTAQMTERLFTAAYELRQIDDLLGNSDAVFGHDQAEAGAFVPQLLTTDPQPASAPILH
jgi:CRP-like cAMP-binding protein